MTPYILVDGVNDSGERSAFMSTAGVYKLSDEYMAFSFRAEDGVSTFHRTRAFLEEGHSATWKQTKIFLYRKETAPRQSAAY